METNLFDFLYWFLERLLNLFVFIFLLGIGSSGGYLIYSIWTTKDSPWPIDLFMSGLVGTLTTVVLTFLIIKIRDLNKDEEGQ